MIRSPSGNDAGTIIKEIDIAAPPSVVWKSLTDQEQLVNWLPFEATVYPGAGGTMKMSWGDPVTEESSIEIWEPERHLRLKEITPFGEQFEPAEAKKAPPRVVDYELNSIGEKTVLRLTHTGFAPPPPSFQETAEFAELAGLAQGLSPMGFRNTVAACWDHQMSVLGDYCENHAGQARIVSWVRHPVLMSFTDAWSRLSGILHMPSAGGIRPVPSVKTSFAGLQPEERYSFQAATGDTFTGKVFTYTENKQFGGTVDNLNGILRIVLSYTVGKPDLSVWLVRYSAPETAISISEQQWNKLFEQRWMNVLAKALA